MRGVSLETPPELVRRNCVACKRPFEVRAGSLRRVCRREDCVASRQAERRIRSRREEQERAEVEQIRGDPEVRVMWPEIMEVIGQASTLGYPGKEDLAKAVARIARVRGAPAMRDALLVVASLALRWAANLPKPGRPTDPPTPTQNGDFG